MARPCPVCIHAQFDQYESEARVAWLASGGEDAEFTKNRPTLRDEHLRQRATERMGACERKVAEMVEKMKTSGRYSPL